MMEETAHNLLAPVRSLMERTVAFHEALDLTGAAICWRELWSARRLENLAFAG